MFEFCGRFSNQMNEAMFEDFEGDDDNEYDDFFFESVQRYQTLQMFNLENIPKHVFQINDTSICVASDLNKGNKSELLQLQLPEKLILGPEEQERSKGNDFKILCGVYTENIVWEIDKLENPKKILISEQDVEGVKIYDFEQDLGNHFKYEKLKAVSWKKPNINAFKKTNKIICSKCDHEPVIIINAEIDQIIKKISHPFFIIDFKSLKSKKDSCTLNNIKCQALNNNMISVLNSCNGNLVLHDLRTFDSFTPLQGPQSQHNEELWSISRENFQNDFGNYFGTLSNRLSFYIYDIRMNSMVLKNIGNDAPSKNHSNLRLLFNYKENRFSISGTNAFVEVFSYDGFNYKKIFIHNGHCPKNSSSNFVTDHIWLSAGSKEYIISLCDNKTLNCWEFNSNF